MRSTLAAALLLVAAAVAATFICSSQALSTEKNPVCCTKYHTKKPLPAGILASYKLTSNKCPLPAVIFVTKRNRQVCVNPHELWTQHRIVLLSSRHPRPAATG
ncbi:C-C motif chemokine 5-like [Tiliqua scincoides]|uniref:C-C motif chemokine 5-like n=1 Tax=Tiliqua scincoides TaxID=71010 RepID=UPI003462FC74